MPATPRPSNKPPADTARRSFVLPLFLGGLVAVPIYIVTSGRWFGIHRAVPGDDRPLPQWVMPPELRSNTRDGGIVKVRVALDAATSSNKSALQRHLLDVMKVLEVAIGARNVADLAGAQGIRRLADDMLGKLNAYLDAKQMDRVTAVAIQDLWYTRP